MNITSCDELSQELLIRFWWVFLEHYVSTLSNATVYKKSEWLVKIIEQENVLHNSYQHRSYSYS